MFDLQKISLMLQNNLMLQKNTERIFFIYKNCINGKQAEENQTSYN